MLLAPKDESREMDHSQPPQCAGGSSATADMASGMQPPQMHLRVSHRGPWLQFRSPHDFQWNVADLQVASLPPPLAGFRIVHVTDFHLRHYWCDAYDHLIERLRADVPDLLLLTGDFVEDKHDHRPALPTVERLLTGMRARLGIYAILGNHDGHLLGPRLAGWNVTMLDGRHVTLHKDGAAIELVGVPGPDRLDLTDGFLRGVPAKAPGAVRLVLSHFPDHLADLLPMQPDVVLAGHTHGGQICLPGGIPLLTHSTLPRRFCRGIHLVERTWLVANRGFGFSSFLPLRLFCPAEVIELRLLPSGVSAPVPPPETMDASASPRGTGVPPVSGAYG